MKKTEQEIQNFMELLSKWGCLKDLTVNDRDVIKYRLKLIAGSAVNETQNEIVKLIPTLYNKITNI
jgi:hypothetical protein